MEYLMKKIILSLALFGAITNVSAEMVAPGVEMTSHQTWTTGNASGHVEDSNDVFFSSASARASTSSFYGKIYQNIYMNGHHSFSMQNTSKETKQFNVAMKLCANSSNCIYDSRSYNVSSGGSYYNDTNLYLTSSFSNVGTYSLTANTTISGESSSSDNSNASIYVSK
ncbi:hypothetical protein TUM19329_07030 [Legionella antarctica]|uniref:Uncharacterized protein n=2 Tax=Legionella antarctica TaxID=2708020 RepID=A0A6F8T2U6_9GAMM|nr:hypothetical protein TUM19329_07030 [Legionella antarctica]